MLAVGEDDWRANQRAWKTLDDLGIDSAAHRSKPCHSGSSSAATTPPSCRFRCAWNLDDNAVASRSELVTTAAEQSEVDRTVTVERRKRRHTTKARTEWVSDRLRTGRPIAAADAFPLAITTWIHTAPYMTVQRAMKLLGIDYPADRYVDYAAALHDHLTGDSKRLNAVAVALVAATAEDRARLSLGSATVIRYLDAIERLGYQPTAWEQTRRLTTAA